MADTVTRNAIVGLEVVAVAVGWTGREVGVGVVVGGWAVCVGVGDAVGGGGVGGAVGSGSVVKVGSEAAAAVASGLSVGAV